MGVCVYMYVFFVHINGVSVFQFHGDAFLDVYTPENWHGTIMEPESGFLEKHRKTGFLWKLSFSGSRLVFEVVYNGFLVVEVVE